LSSVNWSIVTECLDLACGTGRTAEWLKARGIATIDGIDLTPEMLERARAKKLYRSLFLGSVEDTGILHARYDLIVMCLVDEHLATLGCRHQLFVSNPSAIDVQSNVRQNCGAENSWACT
jgi:predicted TPR repeat methyltransferase